MGRKAQTLTGYGETPRVIGDIPEHVKSRSKKDLKRWCGGKEGQEHQGVWIDSLELHCPPNTPQNRQRLAELRSHHEMLFRFLSQVQVCQHCGKHLSWRRLYEEGSQALVFDPLLWKGKDVGDNSQFWKPATILKVYRYHDGRWVANVRFDHRPERESIAHFLSGMKPL